MVSIHCSGKDNIATRRSRRWKVNHDDELQKNYYTDYIQAQPGWVFVGIYADEGISGTSLEHRKGMQQLIEDCKAGKIDLVLTKSIARFARNIVDCLSVIELLKNLNPEIYGSAVIFHKIRF